MNYVSYIFEEITQIIDPAKIMMMTLFTFSTIFPFFLQNVSSYDK